MSTPQQKKKINRQKQEGNQYRKPKCFINRFVEKDNKDVQDDQEKEK